MSEDNLLPNANFGMALVSSVFFSGTTAYAIVGNKPESVALATASGAIIGLLAETARATLGGDRNACETLPIAGMTAGCAVFVGLLVLGARSR